MAPACLGRLRPCKSRRHWTTATSSTCLGTSARARVDTRTGRSPPEMRHRGMVVWLSIKLFEGAGDDIDHDVLAHRLGEHAECVGGKGLTQEVVVTLGGN